MLYFSFSHVDVACVLMLMLNRAADDKFNSDHSESEWVWAESTHWLKDELILHSEEPWSYFSGTHTHTERGRQSHSLPSISDVV